MADFWTSIGDFLGLNKGKATTSAADQNAGLLSDLETKGTGYLNSALDNNQSLIDLYRPGAQLYGDALGINGAQGNANATAAFQHSPGYQQALDEGTQQILRTAAARGDLGGGGVGVDLMKYGVGAADQDYNNWLSGLSGYNGLLSSATGATNGSLGDLAQFAEDITSGRMGANNQAAAGQEAGQGGLWNLLGNAASVVGAGVGAATGMNKLGSGGGFTGYGTY